MKDLEGIRIREEWLQSYRALPGILLTRTHSFTGPSWLPSSLCRYTALYTGPPFLTCFHPHSTGYVLTPSSLTFAPFLAPHLHPTLHLLHLSLPSHPTPGSTIQFAQRLVTSLCPFSSLSPDQKLSICFPVYLCIILQSLSSQPVTVRMCFYSFQPVITDYFYFAGTHCELLPPFNSMAWLWFFHTCLQTIFLLVSPPQHEVYPAHYQPLITSDTSFLCSLSHTTDAFGRSHDSADFPSLLACPTLQLSWQFPSQENTASLTPDPNQKAQLSSHHLWLIAILFHLSPLLSLSTEKCTSFLWQKMNKKPTYPSATFGSTSSVTAPWDGLQRRCILLVAYLHVTPPLNYLLISFKNNHTSSNFFFFHIINALQFFHYCYVF